jgi:hypothetical protein
MQAVPRSRTYQLTAPVSRNSAKLREYFDSPHSGVPIVEEGLKELTFGEFLVERGVVDRFQLFRALQMQDRQPGVKVGEAAAALGYAPIATIEKLYEEFVHIPTTTVL